LVESLAHYERASRLDPDLALAQYNWGVALSGLGRFGDSLSHIREATRIDPDFADAHNNLGNALKNLQRLDEALTQYRETLRIDPGHAHAHNNLAWLYATSHDDAIRDGSRAVEHALRAVDQQGEGNPLLLDTLAAAYAEARDFEAALRWQTKAVELAPAPHKGELVQRLKLYEQQKSYREQSPAAPSRNPAR
jgi:tetratricopeptide (TPR) repeat protein